MKILSKPIEITRIEGIPVYLTYKTVKRINFCVKRDRINISASPYFTKKEILQAIERNREKIKRGIQTVKKKKPPYQKNIVKNVSEVKSVLLFGKNYEIEFNKDVSNFELTDNKLYIPDSFKDLEPSTFLNYLDDFIKLELTQYISQRINYWCQKTGLECSEFRIRKMTSRWGSCTIKKKTFRFNFYLAMFPENIIDSVIIHELCHLKEPNHQKEFYDLLCKYNPDYEIDNEFLKHYYLPIEYIFSE